ncbi:cob(I)yrinic acid a,c-diamide adenosyltransferase [Limibacter armeniacum]|uniref:cob(I)yrinic acid a,c-diamide adenosyltransferase n=1 Tax=Limibacter armeniacum TaxID=466084 RepID=UPI002FE67A7F
MKIYTKTGDKGQTSLFGGKRVSKAHLRIEAYGTVDELLSYIGLVRDQEVNKSRKEDLKEIQDRLFTLGAALAADPDKPKLKKPDLFESDVEWLESEMDKMNEELPALTHFVLPGGHQSVSFCHLARVVCRRAERLTIRLMEDGEEVDELITKYLNRLSDYLFVLSRKMAKEIDAEEVPWIPRTVSK